MSRAACRLPLRAMKPDFLVIGHISQDIVPEAPGGWRLGGTAAYAARLAQQLGLQAAVLTSAAAGLDLTSALPGIAIVTVPAPVSTAFENRYRDGRRFQTVRQRAADLTPAYLPDVWREARIVLLGPLLGEVSDDMAGQFPQALIGACLQGWLRRLDAASQVYAVPACCLHLQPLFRNAYALFLSQEDLAPGETVEAVLRHWATAVPVVVYTMGRAGAQVWERGHARWLPPFPVPEVDPTGAGDVFAAAFLIRLAETDDLAEAARFAGAAAALSVGAPGIEGVPERPAIVHMLQEHPEIRLS